MAMHRSTPLDDAIQGKFWMCAKLLYCFGAKYTVQMTQEIRKAMEDVSMDEITQLVKDDKVSRQQSLG